MPTFDTPDPISVILDLGAADVHISASDRADTVVDVQPTNPANKGDVTAAEQTTVEFRDGELRVSMPKGWLSWLPWNGRESIDVRIDVPTGSRLQGSAGIVALRCTGRVGECRYKMGAGSIRIDDAGPVTLAAGAGDLEIGHAISRVDLKAASGAVRIDEVDGTAVIKNSNGDTSIGAVTGELRVNASNGDVAVRRADATVIAKSARGDIRLDSVETGKIVAETAKGNVEVGIRPGVAAWLDLDTAFGSVRNELDATGPPASGENAVDIRARTAMGDVTIRRATGDEST
jgi:hypothetical protein